MKDIYGIGDIAVLKFRNITLAGTPIGWKYFASSPNRYNKKNGRFGERTYENIASMAKGIRNIINKEENIRVVSGKPLTIIKPGEGLQYSNLNENELLELTKQILLLRAENKLEKIAQD